MSDGAMGSGSEERRYDPGPSFVENDRPSVRLQELPAWLQTFASSVGEPEEDEVPPADEPSPVAETEQAADTGRVGGSDMLPDWLQEDDSAKAEAQSTPPPEPQDSAPSFMISEDDLPDWLRSIPGEASAAPTPIPSPTAPANEAPSLNGTIEVPRISRAWVNATTERELSDGGSVFALVASQIEPVAAGYTAARGLEGSATPTHGTSDSGYAKLRSEDADEGPAQDSTEGPASDSRRLRIALLVLLLLIIVALVVFGQMQ